MQAQIESIPTIDTLRIRKLPRRWRLANLVYQIALILLTFANAILTVINAENKDLIPRMYFELYTVAISGLPVVWSKILDEVKQYHEISSPRNSVAATSEPAPTPTPTTTPRTLARNRSCSMSQLEDLHLTQDFLELLKSKASTVINSQSQILSPS